LYNKNATIYYEGSLFYVPSELTPKSISEVDGLYSIVMKTKNEVYFVADKLGTKTIYYVPNDKKGEFVFSTSIKELLSSTDKEVDLLAISDYLTFRTSLGDRTFFKNVKQIPGGCYLKIYERERKYNLEKYWSIPFLKVRDISFGKAVSMFEDLLMNVIKKNVGSCKKVALFLSGGIDSTVLAVALSKMGIDFTAYTAHFSEREYDELDFAEKVANCLGFEHKVIYCTPEKYFRWLEELTRVKYLPVGQINEPIIYGMLKEVKEDPIFFGSAADELFGGYTRIFASTFWYERNIKKDSVDARYNHIAKRYGYFSFNEKKSILNLVTNSLEAIKEKLTTDEDFFNNLTRIFLYYHDPALIQRIRAGCEATGHSFRLPFADPRIIEFALSLPRKYKMYWKSNEAHRVFTENDVKSEEQLESFLRSKILLRKSFNRFVENTLPERPKIGFSVPLSAWFAQNPAIYTPLVLNNESKNFYKIFNKKGVLQFLNRKSEKNTDDWSRKLFMLFSLHLWLRECVER